jgi:hypothetical protein
MQGFDFRPGFTSRRPSYGDQAKMEAVIQARGERNRTETKHAPLPWRMKADGRNRTWLVDAYGANVPMTPGNLRLILRALKALEAQELPSSD